MTAACGSRSAIPAVPTAVTIAHRASRVSSLAVWDIQAHRSLAAQPSRPNPACVARVQALLATTSGVVVEAAAQTGQVDSAASEWFATRIDTSERCAALRLDG
jgi:hypothetical protein